MEPMKRLPKKTKAQNEVKGLNRLGKQRKQRRLRGGNIEWLGAIAKAYEGTIGLVETTMDNIKIEYEKITEEQQKTFDKWIKFYNIFKDEKERICKDRESCKDEDDEDDEGMPENEAIIQARIAIEKFRTKKPNKPLIRCANNDSNSTEDCSKEPTTTEIIASFDEIFKGILMLVIPYTGEGKVSTKGSSREGKVSTKGSSKGFKNMIRLIRALPNIDNNLNALIAEDIKDLNDRYRKILELLSNQCSGIIEFACSLAASAIGKDILALYKNLKEKGDTIYVKNKSIIIDENTLIEFIQMVIPIMITNLTGITEFDNVIASLADLAKNINPSKGGKKSSRGVRKEANHAKPRKPTAKPVAKHTKKLILGKERCIYKVQGSKKEHIKYKGVLIPVADYKKLMGA